jgi:energy-converting hydrogenase Eha subunit E
VPTPTPTASPLTIVNAVNLGNSPVSMSTLRLTFNRAIAAATFTAADVALTGPDGLPITVTSVAAAPGYAGYVFDVSFATQTKPGAYSLKVGPDIADPAGVTMASAFTRTFTLTGGTPSSTPPPAPAPTTTPLAIVNAVNLGNSPISMSTLRLTFNRAIAAATFTAADVTLTGPDGLPIAVTSVAAAPGYAGYVFDVSFATQTKPGAYSLKVGPDIADPAGVTMASAFSRTFSLSTPTSASLADVVGYVAPPILPAPQLARPVQPLPFSPPPSAEVLLPPWMAHAPAVIPTWNTFESPSPSPRFSPPSGAPLADTVFSWPNGLFSPRADLSLPWPETEAPPPDTGSLDELFADEAWQP